MNNLEQEILKEFDKLVIEHGGFLIHTDKLKPANHIIKQFISDVVIQKTIEHCVEELRPYPIQPIGFRIFEKMLKAFNEKAQELLKGDK